MDMCPRPSPAPSLLLNLAPMTNKEARHLAKVFAVLTMGVVATICGVFAHNLYNLGGMLAFLVSLFCLSRVFESRYLWKQKVYFMSFEFTQGLSIGYITSVHIESQRVILALTFASCLAVFGCFSIASMFTRRRQYLYLISVFSSVLIYIAVICILDMYLDFLWAYDFTVLCWLMVFVGYVLIESQCALERKHDPTKHGWRSHYQHAADAYVDIIGFFCRFAAKIFLLGRRLRYLSLRTRWMLPGYMRVAQFAASVCRKGISLHNRGALTDCRC